MSNASTVHRILVLDDDRLVVRMVCRALEEAGYTVWSATSLHEAMKVIRQRGLPHLAIVDLNLAKKENGIDFCRKIHRVADLPVIILSSEADEMIVSDAIDMCAEDYIVKGEDGSIRFKEMVARVGRLLRRVGDFAYTLDETVYVDDYLQVNFTDRLAICDGEKIKLTPTETKILHILMRFAGRTVNIDYMLRRLWPMESAGEDRLHSHIYRLRRKVETDPTNPFYVVSEWGTGYIFPPPVKNGETIS